MNKVNFTAINQTVYNLSRIRVTFLPFIIAMLFLPSCALLSHKTPVQRVINTGLKTVHTLDVYAEKNTIHALFSGLDSSQKLALKYITSLNAGKTWSAPISVNRKLAPLKKSKRGNDFRIAAYGSKVMAVWQSKGGEPWTGKIAVALSSDFGKTWQQIASPISDQYEKIDQGYFDLTADNQGQFHIVWLDDREEAGNTQALRYARYSDQSGNAWESHKTLELTACTCCWTSIIADKKNDLHVLYRDDSPRDMKIISSFNNGNSWQKSKTAGSFGWKFIGCPHQGGGLAGTQTDGKTILHSALWNGKADSRGIYYSQFEPNKDKIAVLLPIGDNNSASGDIAALDNSHLGIAYTAGDFESKSVTAKFSGNGGLSWSNEQRLTGDSAEPSHPRIIATPSGFRFFWTEWQENGDAVAIISELK